jgi:hypothetical protein
MGCFITMGDIETGLGQASGPLSPSEVQSGSDLATPSSSTASFLNIFSALTTAGAQVGSAALQAQAARQRSNMPGVPAAPTAVVVAQPAQPGMSTGAMLAIAGAGILAAGGLYYFLSSDGGSRKRHATPAPAPTPSAPVAAPEPVAPATKANPNKRGRKGTKKCKVVQAQRCPSGLRDLQDQVMV